MAKNNKGKDKGKEAPKGKDKGKGKNKGGNGRLSFLTPEQKEQYKIIEKKQGKASAEDFASGIAKDQGNDFVKAYDKNSKDINKNFIAGKDILENLGVLDPLDRIDYTTPQDQQDYIKRMDELAMNAGKRPEDVQAALDQQGAQVKTTAEMNAALAGLKDAQARTAETSLLLKTMEGGLAGLSAAENQAMRESSARASESALKTALSNVQQTAARSGARGFSTSANLANVNRQFTKDRLQQEQDLQLANIDIQDRRRDAYGREVGSAENREQSRRADYTGALGKEEGAQYDRATGYQEALRGATQEENTRAVASNTLYGGALNDRNTMTRRGQEFNALQGNAEAAAKAAGVMGMGDYFLNTIQGNRQLDIAEKESNKAAPEASSGGSSGGSGNPNDLAAAYAAEIQKQKDYYENQARGK